MPVVLGEPDVIKTIQLMPGVQSGMEGFPESMCGAVEQTKTL